MLDDQRRVSGDRDRSFEGSRDLFTRLAGEGDGLKDHARG
jgi:hypothetical protein